MKVQVLDEALLGPQLVSALRILEMISDAAGRAAEAMDGALCSRFDIDPDERSEADFMSLPEVAHDMWELVGALTTVACAYRPVRDYIQFLQTNKEPTPLRDDDLPF